MLRWDFQGSTKTKAATTAETLTFSGNEIQGLGVRAYFFTFTGTDDDYDSLTRLRAKAGGVTFWDADETHHKALVQRMAPSNFDFANADVSWTLPLYSLNSPKDSRRWVLGFPSGQVPTLEVVTDATGAAGTLGCGWLYDDNALPEAYPYFVASPANVAASQTNQFAPLSAPGFVKAITINTTGLTSARLILNGVQVMNLSGALLIQATMMENSDVDTDPICFVLEDPMPAPAGNSGIYLTTGATWGGVTNEIGVYSVVPLQAAA